MKCRRRLPKQVLKDIRLFDSQAKCVGFATALTGMIQHSLKEDYEWKDPRLMATARSIYRDVFRPCFSSYPDSYSLNYQDELLRIFQVQFPTDSKRYAKNALKEWGWVWLGMDGEIPTWAFEVHIFDPLKRTFLTIPIQRFALQNLTGVRYDSERLTAAAEFIGMDLND